MIVIEYTRELFAIIEQVKDALSPLMLELPMLVDSAAAERRLDAGEGRAVRELARVARERLRASVAPAFADDFATRFATRTSLHQKNQLLRQTKAALGVDLFIADTGTAALVDGFVAENVALIQSIPEKLLTDVETTVTRGFQRGTNVRDLTSQISDRFGLARNRARLIARDQIGSLVSQLNRVRQASLGVTEYIWRTAGDERVRSEHEDRDGEKFRWDTPPDDGHPGEPISCRCTPEPIFDDILSEAA